MKHCELFVGKVTGWRGAIEMLLKSSDITPMEFFFWGIVRDKVYVQNHK